MHGLQIHQMTINDYLTEPLCTYIWLLVLAVQNKELNYSLAMPCGRLNQIKYLHRTIIAWSWDPGSWSQSLTTSHHNCRLCACVVCVNKKTLSTVLLSIEIGVIYTAHKINS